MPVWIRKKDIFRELLSLFWNMRTTPAKFGTKWSLLSSWHAHEQLTQRWWVITKQTAASGHRISALTTCFNPLLIPSIFLVICSWKYKIVNIESTKDRSYGPWKWNTVLQLVNSQVKNFQRIFLLRLHLIKL